MRVPLIVDVVDEAGPRLEQRRTERLPVRKDRPWPRRGGDRQAAGEDVASLGVIDPCVLGDDGRVAEVVVAVGSVRLNDVEPHAQGCVAAEERLFETERL